MTLHLSHLSRCSAGVTSSVDLGRPSWSSRRRRKKRINFNEHFKHLWDPHGATVIDQMAKNAAFDNHLPPQAVEANANLLQRHGLLTCGSEEAEIRLLVTPCEDVVRAARCGKGGRGV